MPKDAHVAVPRWRWIGAVGLVAAGRRSRRGLVSDQGSRQARPSRRSSSDPGPGGRRATGGDQRRQPVLRVRRPDQGHRQGRAARPRRGLPRKGPVQGGPGRQDGRPALPDREGAVRGGGRPGQGKSRCCRGRADQRQAAIRPQSRTVEAPVQSAEPGRPGQGGARFSPRQDPAAAGGAEAGPAQSRATPTSGRRSTAASAAPLSPSAISSTRQAACWRPSSARIRSMCCSR